MMKKFEDVSGLCLNSDKTVVMPLGDLAEPEWGNSVGFCFKNSVKVLGHTLDKEGSIVTAAHGEICWRVAAETNKWSQYGMMLSGRIRVAKCYVYGQINYHGLLAELNSEDILNIERMIAWFVAGKNRIAHKIFVKLSEGGLGLPGVKACLPAQRARLWTVASVQDDIWREKFIEKAGGNTGWGLMNYDGCSQVIKVLLEGWEAF